MSGRYILVITLLLAALVAPVLAEDVGRYSYIVVEDVRINLVNDRATIEVDYSIDEGIRFLVMLLGKNDMKIKLEHILNFDNARFREAELDHAVLVIDEASYDYGDGSYWFPEHEFNIIIPKVTVNTPQATRNHTITKTFPNGIGYFAV
jgi:hypothetical protein